MRIWSGISQHWNCVAPFVPISFIKVCDILVRSSFADWSAAGGFWGSCFWPSCPSSSNAAMFSPCRARAGTGTCLGMHIQILLRKIMYLFFFLYHLYWPCQKCVYHGGGFLSSFMIKTILFKPAEDSKTFGYSHFVLCLKQWLKWAGLLVPIWICEPSILLLHRDGLIWISEYLCTKTGSPSLVLWHKALWSGL